MIRSALTLSISLQDAQTTSFLVNGTHLGLLSSAPQNTHVQTTHRPMQMIVALKDLEPVHASSLLQQRQRLSAWQEFMPILGRRPGGDLNKLLNQYHLFPHWMIVFDEHRLQAWLPPESGFYLLRDHELRRMRPTSPRDDVPASADYSDGPRQYYTFSLQQNDQFFLLPPALFNLFTAGEAADVLAGLRQQPAKVAELISTARMRGYREDFSWLAMQVLRLEEDYLPGAAKKSDSGFFGQPKQNTSQDPDSEAVDLKDENAAEQSTGQNNTSWTSWPQRKALYWLGGGLLLMILLIIAIILLSLPEDEPVFTDMTSTTAAQPSQTATPALPTLTPTPGPTPTPALPQLIVSARRLNLRAEPTRDSTLLDTLENGDILYQLSEPADNWVKVRTAEGLEGFVYFSYVTKSDNG